MSTKRFTEKFGESVKGIGPAAAYETCDFYRRTTCPFDAAPTGDPWDWDAEHANDDTIQRYRWDSEVGDQRHGAAKSRP